MHSLPKRIIQIFFIFVSSISIVHAQLPDNNPVPGGIAVVNLYKSEVQPSVKFGNRQISVINNNSRWYALVGLPHDITPGRYIITLTDETSETKSLTFKVLPRGSLETTQALVLPEFLQQYDFQTPDSIQFESESRMTQLDTSNVDFIFNMVSDYRHVIPYGLLQNSDETSAFIQHAQVSLLTKPDELVFAPKRGEVIEAIEHSNIDTKQPKTYTIYLDHGAGIVSVLSHLSETILKKGDVINAGEIIGTTETILGGEYGRVSWGVLMNDYYIDPLQFSSSS